MIQLQNVLFFTPGLVVPDVFLVEINGHYMYQIKSWQSIEKILLFLLRIPSAAVIISDFCFHFGSDNYSIWCLTLLLLITTCPVLANSVDPDQLASEEANWSGSALFVIKYVNFY